MSVTEVSKLTGISRTEIDNMLHIRGQNFGWKTAGGGKWLIDYEKFNNFLQSRTGWKGHYREKLH